MAEIAFEALLAGIETTPGTKVNPTHYANMIGSITPRNERYVPEEARGSYVARYRSRPVRWWGELQAEGPLDVYLLPLFLSMSATGNLTGQPTTPGGGTNSRLWTFLPNNTEDDLDKATFWWGERNTQMWYGAYGHINELRITNDASGTDGAMMTLTGATRKPAYEEFVIEGATAADPVAITTTTNHGLVDGTKVFITGVVGMVELNDRFFTIDDAATDTFTLVDEDGTGHTAYVSGGTVRVVAPPFPSQLTAPLIIGQEMQMWLDTSSAIGTTAITGRLISAEHTIPVGYVPKYLATGPGSDGSFTRLGRPTRSLTTTIKLELLDLDQMELFEDNTTVKLRVRHNGPLIEGSLYHYFQVDTYGPMTLDEFTDLEGVNRAVQFTVVSEYDATLGADWRVLVQNDRATL